MTVGVTTPSWALPEARPREQLALQTGLINVGGRRGSRTLDLRLSRPQLSWFRQLVMIQVVDSKALGSAELYAHKKQKASGSGLATGFRWSFALFAITYTVSQTCDTRAIYYSCDIASLCYAGFRATSRWLANHEVRVRQ
jgi:hypothetical protein